MANRFAKSFGTGAISKEKVQSKSRLLYKCSENDSSVKNLLQHIFLSPTLQNVSLSVQYPELPPQPSVSRKDNLEDLSSLSVFLDAVLGDIKSQYEASHINRKKSDIGRLGLDNVVFDTNGNSGTLIIEADRLGVASHSNFSTIRANCCVMKGKWVYELMLGSKGVMQLGWCTLSCKFSHEEGVGDTNDSYAYDGNRLRKWNVTTQKYGEAWLTGDVISCALDCDEGKVFFFRNGKPLGQAFSNVRLGQGIAYFPAVSLSRGENLRANFGATPLRYPLDHMGFQPLQEPPKLDLLKTQCLFNYLERILVEMDIEKPPNSQSETAEAGKDLTQSEKRSKKASLMLMAAHVFDKLAPLLKSTYVIEAKLFQFFLKFCNSDAPMQEQPMILKSLDLLWAFLQDYELKPCLDHLVVSLLSSYRFSPVTPDFTFQYMYLTMTLAILRHERTRRYLLLNVFFDKIKFPIFLHVKPPDDDGLKELIPTVWWDVAKEQDDDETPVVEETEESKSRKEAFLKSCELLRQRVTALEDIQVEMLKMLLNDKDIVDGISSRSIFQYKFREFLKENSNFGLRSHLVNQCPLPVSLCFFHRLIKALRQCWDEYASENPNIAVTSAEAFVPYLKFCDGKIKYNDIHRLGGLLSHLNKTYTDDLVLALGSKPLPSNESEPAADSDYSDAIYKRATNDDPDGKHLASAGSLVEILDGVIMLFAIAAHKQLTKMCTLKETVNDFVGALEDTEKKMADCPDELQDVKMELERAKTVFIEKASEQSRHMAWVIAVIYAKEKQEDVFWLWQVCLRTIEQASEQKALLCFVPDFYMEACINAYNAIRGFFHPTVPYESLPGFSNVIQRYAVFLSHHFSDSRIVNTDTKDTVVQALACFVCYSTSLKALENIPHKKGLEMIKALLSPYEKRSWAQTNWILVRLWKGCGFGFRYKHLPHLLPAKNQQQELGNASLQRPCPSTYFQGMIATFLNGNPEEATKLIDTLLNQLNWAFSEFIGMLQELQQIRARPSANIIYDSRQLKICATCFDLAVGLLRVLEMIIHLVPEVVTDWKRPTAELLLSRLFQLLTQVLNRVTSRSNIFETMIADGMPGLETVDHFPIITAVTGILIGIIHKTEGESKECATSALLADSGFQLSSLEFLLGGVGDQAAAPVSAEKKIFSLKKYKEVSSEEIEEVENLTTYLRVQKNKIKAQSPDIDEDLLCNICYARPKSARFRPCGHESCRSCIKQHLMMHKVCFFCKATINTVDDY